MAKTATAYPVATKLDELMAGKLSSQGITGLRKALENDSDCRYSAQAWYSRQTSTEEQKFEKQYPSLYTLIYS